TPHERGWSDEAWGLVREATATSRDHEPIDRRWQQLAVASLVRLDARTVKQFRDFGARSVAFDPDGRRLLMGGVTDAKNGRRTQGARLWDGVSPGPEDLQVAEEGPVGFRIDGTPVQLVVRKKEGTLTLM